MSYDFSMLENVFWDPCVTCRFTRNRLVEKRFVRRIRFVSGTFSISEIHAFALEMMARQWDFSNEQFVLGYRMTEVKGRIIDGTLQSREGNETRHAAILLFETQREGFLSLRIYRIRLVIGMNHCPTTGFV